MPTHVLLINPGIKESSQNRVINSLVNITFPTSLGILAAFLRSRKTTDCLIIDEQLGQLTEAKLKVHLGSLKEPRIVGISVLTLNAGRAYELAALVKRLAPETTVVLGGIHPTVLTEEALNQAGVDAVVKGEGEETFNELVASVVAGRNFRAIEGVAYLQDGKVITTAPRPLIQELDTIPEFPYDLFASELGRYPNFSGILSSRGCPYRCAFCSSRSVSGMKYRFHSVGRIIKEIKTLIETYKQDSVFFRDDNIGVNKKHFNELCGAIISEGLHKRAFFHGSLRGDDATDELLDNAYRANFRILYFGLETGSEKLMRVINKGETVQEVVDAINRSHKKGFTVGTTLIFGLPSETQVERQETVKLVRSLPLQSARFNTLVPYPGTPFFEQEYPKGHIFVKGIWENFGVQYMWESDDIPYAPDTTGRLELIFDTMWANLSYYLSFSGLKKLFTQKFAAGNVVRLKSAWYLSFSQLFKMFALFVYLMRRFIFVWFRSVFRRRAKQKTSFG